MNLQTLASLYESAALRMTREAAERGEDAPKLVSVFAHQGGYTADFVAPRASLMEIRKAIITSGGAFRISMA